MVIITNIAATFIGYGLAWLIFFILKSFVSLVWPSKKESLEDPLVGYLLKLLEEDPLGWERNIKTGNSYVHKSSEMTFKAAGGKVDEPIFHWLINTSHRVFLNDISIETAYNKIKIAKNKMLVKQAENNRLNNFLKEEESVPSKVIARYDSVAVMLANSQSE